MASFGIQVASQLTSHPLGGVFLKSTSQDLPAPESVGRSQPSLYLPRVSLTGHFWVTRAEFMTRAGGAIGTYDLKHAVFSVRLSIKFQEVRRVLQVSRDVDMFVSKKMLCFKNC